GPDVERHQVRDQPDGRRRFHDADRDVSAGLWRCRRAPRSCQMEDFGPMTQPQALRRPVGRRTERDRPSHACYAGLAHLPAGRGGFGARGGGNRIEQCGTGGRTMGVSEDVVRTIRFDSTVHGDPTTGTTSKPWYQDPTELFVAGFW